MTLKVFAVRDMKALAFLQPFFSNSVGSALRAFGDAVSDNSCPFAKHPEDYVLYEIGTYDDSTAELQSVSPVKMMACASDFVAAVEVGMPIKHAATALEMEAVSNGGSR